MDVALWCYIWDWWDWVTSGGTSYIAPTNNTMLKRYALQLKWVLSGCFLSSLLVISEQWACSLGVLWVCSNMFKSLTNTKIIGHMMMTHLNRRLFTEWWGWWWRWGWWWCWQRWRWCSRLPCYVFCICLFTYIRISEIQISWVGRSTRDDDDDGDDESAEGSEISSPPPPNGATDSLRPPPMFTIHQAYQGPHCKKVQYTWQYTRHNALLHP